MRKRRRSRTCAASSSAPCASFVFAAVACASAEVREGSSGLGVRALIFSSASWIDLEDVRVFQVHLVSKEISWAALNQTVCALRFFFGVTLGHGEIPERIPYARQPPFTARCVERRRSGVLSRSGSEPEDPHGPDDGLCCGTVEFPQVALDLPHRHAAGVED